MSERWRCTTCDNVYAERPSVCTDCAGSSFEPVGNVDADRRWRCTGCGIEFEDRPSVCTDCGAGSFEPTGESGRDRNRRTVPGAGDSSGESFPASPGDGTPGRNWTHILGVIALVTVGAALLAGVISPGMLATNPCADVGNGAADSPTVDRQYIECTFHDRVMAYREANGYSDLRFDAGRREVAREMAEEMARNGYGPGEASGRFDLDERLRSCAADGRTNWAVYQRLSYDALVETQDGSVTSYDTNRELVDGFLANLRSDATDGRTTLRDGYRSHAVGVYVTGDGEVYLVQLFC